MTKEVAPGGIKFEEQGTMENEPLEPPLNLERVLVNLLNIKERYGLDISEDDIDGLRELIGEDDNDFLGNLVSLIADVEGITVNDFLTELGIPTDYVVELLDSLEIEGDTE